LCRLGWKDGDKWFGVVLHDVNGTGTLYGRNWTERRGGLHL
jgi:hypothetical protein